MIWKVENVHKKEENEMLLIEAIKKPWKIISSRRLPFLSDIMSDKFFLKCAYRTALEEKLDLETPSNYNEKIQWPLMTEMIDILK